jgi:cob(I)alamin adenosyltransferase
MNQLKKGYVQIYTGNGKGKTTAALGQALRGAGFGLKSYIFQFMKEYPYSELNSLKFLYDFIKIEQFGNDDFVSRGSLPNKSEIDKIKLGMNIAQQIMLGKEHDIIILDEICVCIYFKLISSGDVLDFISKKPASVELILTGRYCPPEIIEKGDIVTEMKEIKHYYSKGVASRKGIES